MDDFYRPTARHVRPRRCPWGDGSKLALFAIGPFYMHTPSICQPTAARPCPSTIIIPPTLSNAGTLATLPDTPEHRCRISIGMLPSLSAVLQLARVTSTDHMPLDLEFEVREASLMMSCMIAEGGSHNAEHDLRNSDSEKVWVLVAIFQRSFQSTMASTLSREPIATGDGAL